VKNETTDRILKYMFGKADEIRIVF